MTRVVILGAGVMGAAFANPLSDKGMNVDLVGTHLDKDIIAQIKESRVHPRLKAEVGANVTAYQLDALSDVLSHSCDLIVVGVSTPGARWAIEKLTATMTGTPPIVLLTKGIGETPDRIEILPSVAKRAFAEFDVKHGPIGAVGGPCIAGELAVRRQTSAIIGFDEPDLAAQWAEAISTGYYHLASTTDLTGLEICAALKNFYAIGVSSPHGRLDRDAAPNGAALNNETASLFNQAVAELAKIVKVSGGDPATAFGLAGLGDLHVTTQAGRNSRLGRLIGEGLRCSEAMTGPLAGETVEGALVAQSLKRPLEALDRDGMLPVKDVPLAAAIVKTVNQDAALSVELGGLHQ